MIVAYDVSTSVLSLIMFTRKHPKLMFSMSFDAELYGLQDSGIVCLTNTIWYGRFVEILDSSHFIACQKIQCLGYLDSILSPKWKGIYTVL